MQSWLAGWMRCGSCIGFALLVPGILTLFPSAAVLAAPVVEMTGFTILQETDSGRWEIESEQARYDGDENVVLTGVLARLMDAGKAVVIVRSEKGRFEPDSLLLHLEGKVTMTSAMGATFRAPRVRWDGSGSFMEAEGGVILTRGPLHVTGRSVRYTVSTGIASLHGGVTSVWKERSPGR